VLILKKKGGMYATSVRKRKNSTGIENQNSSVKRTGNRIKKAGIGLGYHHHQKNTEEEEEIHRAERSV